MKVGEAIPKHAYRASLVLSANAEHRVSHLGKLAERSLRLT